jgi:uncharacterized membrane protein YozB (DUF420 family)
MPPILKVKPSDAVLSAAALSVVVAVLSVEALSVVVVVLSDDVVVLPVVDELPQPARQLATMAAVNKILTGFFIITSLFLI